MINITANEKNIIQWIAFNEMCDWNTAYPEELPSACYCWVDEMASEANLTMSQVKGVLSSLTKKDVIFVVEEGPGEDNTVGLTDNGYKVFRELFPIGDYVPENDRYVPNPAHSVKHD
jgi:hypothetical protein